MSSTLAVALLGGALVLVGSAGSGLAYLNLKAREEAMRQRVEAVTVAHLRARPIASAVITRRMTKEPEPLMRRAALLFGYDPVRPDEGLPWYLVLPCTLLVAVIAAEMSKALLGGAALFAVPVFWVLLSRFIWGWRRDKRQNEILMQFPDALSMIVRSVRVGIPVSEAVRMVSRESPLPTSKIFGDLGNEMSIGVPLEAALAKSAERIGLPEYRFFATAISLQTQTGGALGETLENLADVIRRRVALKARGKALSSEARASAAVLALLPILTGGALCVLNPHYMSTLVTDPSGRRALGLAAVLLSSGLLGMRAIVRKVLA